MPGYFADACSLDAGLVSGQTPAVSWLSNVACRLWSLLQARECARQEMTAPLQLAIMECMLVHKARMLFHAFLVTEQCKRATQCIQFFFRI